MRAAEFMRALADVIELLDGSDENRTTPKDPSQLDTNPVMVTPLQQQTELTKASLGKVSPIISKLTQSEVEHDPSNPVFPKNQA